MNFEMDKITNNETQFTETSAMMHQDNYVYYVNSNGLKYDSSESENQLNKEVHVQTKSKQIKVYSNYSNANQNDFDDFVSAKDNTSSVDKMNPNTSKLHVNPISPKLHEEEESIDLLYGCGQKNDNNCNLKDNDNFTGKDTFLFQCKKCNLRFKKQHNYTQHLLNDHGEGPFICGTCQRAFRHEYNLNRHLAGHFSRSSLFCCKICNKDFSSETLLARHLVGHAEVKNEFHLLKSIDAIVTQCSLCIEKFVGEKACREHCLSHCDLDKLECCICKKQMQKISKLEVHLASHEIIKFVCTVCGWMSSRKGSLKRHEGIHTGDNYFECDLCYANFRENRSLKIHYKKKHPEIYGPFNMFKRRKRTYCRKKNPNITKLSDYCDKAFQHENRLLDHTVVHPGINPTAMNCLECGKKFASKWKMNRHFILKHTCTENKGKKIPCTECGKIFETKLLMENHFVQKHADKYSAQFKKRVSKLKLQHFCCEVCGKGFCVQSDLKTHVEIHVSKKHVCEICAEAFCKEIDLLHHMGEEHAKQDILCEHCGESFSNPTAYKMHVLVHDQGPQT